MTRDATRSTSRRATAPTTPPATRSIMRSRWSPGRDDAGHQGFLALPVSDPTPDADWATSPTLFTDSLGRDLVSAANKNGILYAFLRDDVSAGPVWSRRLAAQPPGQIRPPAASTRPAFSTASGSTTRADGPPSTATGGRLGPRARSPHRRDHLGEGAAEQDLRRADGGNGMLSSRPARRLRARPGHRRDPLRKHAEALRRGENRQRAAAHRRLRGRRARVRLPVVAGRRGRRRYRKGRPCPRLSAGEGAVHDAGDGRRTGPRDPRRPRGRETGDGDPALGCGLLRPAAGTSEAAGRQSTSLAGAARPARPQAAVAGQSRARCGGR